MSARQQSLTKTRSYHAHAHAAFTTVTRTVIIMSPTTSLEVIKTVVHIY